MISRRLALVGCALTLVLATCSKSNSSYQGWIEANLIFVAPMKSAACKSLQLKKAMSSKLVSLSSQWMTISNKPIWRKSKLH